MPNEKPPINPATGQPYFNVDPRGWGTGWEAGEMRRYPEIPEDLVDIVLAMGMKRGDESFGECPCCGYDGLWPKDDPSMEAELRRNVRTMLEELFLKLPAVLTRRDRA